MAKHMTRSRPANDAPAAQDDSDALFSEPQTTPTEEGKPSAAASASAKINASELSAGMPCPFTADCSGSVRVFNDITTQRPVDGKQVPFRLQQLWCPTCRSVAAGAKQLTASGVATGGQRLFNRRTGQSE